jgi:uncharacterized protein YkwD
VLFAAALAAAAPIGCAGGPGSVTGSAPAISSPPADQNAASVPARAPRIPRRPAVVYVPGGPGAKVYEAPPISSAGPRGTVKASSAGADAHLDEAERGLLKVVAAAAIEAGVTPPVPDARLHAVASDLAHNARGLKAPPSDVVRFLANHHGVIEPDPAINTLTGPAYLPGVYERYRTSLPHMFKKGRWNRVGVALVQHKETVTVVLTLWEQMVELRPVPRELPSEGKAAVAVRLLGPYKDPQIVVTLPGGYVRALPTMASKDGFLHAELFCNSGDGRYQVEVLASQASGPVVLGNFPVFCGVHKPSDFSAYDEDDAEEIDPDDAEQELLALINQARMAAGLTALRWDNRLAAIARSHSRDMVNAGFVAHISPTTGDALMRIKRAGLAFPLVVENVGQEGGVQQAHRGFMSSPGHRANVVNRKVTHVGIGVVVKGNSGAPLFVTELFAQE